MIDKQNCTGCAACYSVCPVQCISMLQDEEGFVYPSITGTCIDCGKCRKVCPQVNKKVNNEKFTQKAYAALSYDKKIWEKSSSGGAFSEICKVWGDENAYFVGASWEGLKVQHMCVRGISNLDKIKKSKYTESQIGDTFKEIKKLLDNGYRVVFCGTPCQVAGLKAFLNKEEPRLLLIDLICHGVGSPKVFEHCISALEQQFSCKIVSYGFREKIRYYNQDHIQKIKCDNGKIFYVEEDQYIQLFTSQTCLRKSCGSNCKYRNSNRQGDITIGDFKHLMDVFPELLGAKRNYSTIVVNNDKGEGIVKELHNSMLLMPCDIECIKKYNPLFYKHTYFSKCRNEFFFEFTNSAQQTITKWTKPAKLYKKKKILVIMDMLPLSIRKLVYTKRKEYEKKKKGC